MIYILYKIYTRNLHLLPRILFVVFLKIAISMEHFWKQFCWTYGFFLGMSLLFVWKGHCVTKSEVIIDIHFPCYIHSNKTLFDMVKHMLLLFDFFTLYKIRIKIVLLLLFTFYFMMVQVLEMANSGTLVYLYLVNYYRVHWLGSETFPRIVIHENFP